jgi:copper resistance protein C
VTWSRGAALLVVATIAAVFGAPPTASAHSRLERTSPAASTTVDTLVSEVTLTFNENVRQKFSSVIVSGPGAVSYSMGRVRVVDAVVHQPVYALRSGAYTVAWRVVSADDHPVQGQFSFTVTLPADLEPATGPPAASPRSAPSGSGRPVWWWPWALTTGGLAVVVVLAVGFVRRRRS